MTTHAISAARPVTALTLVFTAMLGLGILWMAGHAQAAALHVAAHDVRHATGFPCH